ncbi:hypothetical protein HPB50_004817 [Hyalomma asiaticum]|uniref:Uncharacterized protein n=1 Tax=Hyalomma asiaticum TaxID=266040 RepID=A0ACB7SK41_HYAAI|nr:hypothetical protein HPB50_004817 [Hyalomma asiaticum]
MAPNVPNQQQTQTTADDEREVDSEALLHVSTAYCNFDKKDVLETVYPPPVSAEKLIEIRSVSTGREDGVHDCFLAPSCLYGHPNTYTLTKNVAETLLLEERGDIPVAIVRPSIVTASVKEPLPGWIDNYNGCTGIIVALGAGLLQSLFVDKGCVGDVVPVDYVANMIICVAWKTAQTRPKDVGVYHCTSGALKHATWGHLIDEMLRATRRYPLPNVIRFPEFHLTDSHLWHDINLWCLHYVPARIVDTALQLCSQKPRFVRYYQKARKATDPVRKFMTREWLFRPNNALRLQEELSPRDAQLFDFNVQHIEWSSYVDAYVLGIRKYLLKLKIPNYQKLGNI